VPKKALYLLTIFSTLGLFAQKEVTKTVLDPRVSTLQIDGTHCFEVLLDTSNSLGNTIVLEGKMDGEYSPDLQMNTSTQGSTMFINAGFRPVFELPNDKLGAHKVVSISLKVLVPSGKNVNVMGTSTMVSAHGQYGKLNITLSDGNCFLDHVAQETKVHTQSGSIGLVASAGHIEAHSKYGQVDKNPIPPGEDRFYLNSVTGDIHLNKTE